MLRIAICDDSRSQINIIREFARKHFANVCQYSIDDFDNPLVFLESIEKSGGYDLVLLDICMPGIMGTDVAREIRKRKEKTEIVFLTTSSEYAVEAFELKAAHYIIKPITRENFDEAMNRATNNILESESKKLTVKIEGGNIINVDINDIIYIQSNDHNQVFLMKDNQKYCETRRSLSRIFDELENMSCGQFIAPYKGYIINMKFIVTINSKNIQMMNGDMVPIPRGTLRQIQKQFLDYRFSDANKKLR